MAVARTLPLELELVVYTGTNFRREFRWLPDGTNPQDFTGWSASMLIGPPRGTALIELSTTNGGVTLTALGQVITAATASETATLPSGIIAYQLDLTDPADFVTRLLRGRLSVIQDVSPAP